MTRRLILMRHAKSDWSTSVADHGRPLNKRGVRSAKALGTWLREQDILPDQIISSTAKRARDTASGLGFELNPTPDPRLYDAAPETILSVLREASGHCVLIVGHNPGICAAAHAAVDTAPDHPRFDDYPTGATLVADFGVHDWGEMIPGTGQAVHFLTPRDLE